MPQSNRSPPDDFRTDDFKDDKVMIQVNIFFNTYSRLARYFFLLNKKKRKVWLVIYSNRANDTKLNNFVGLTTHLSRANDN